MRLSTIRKIFLFFSVVEPDDSCKKNSYKKKHGVMGENVFEVQLKENLLRVKSPFNLALSVSIGFHICFSTNIYD